MNKRGFLAAADKSAELMVWIFIRSFYKELTRSAIVLPFANKDLELIGFFHIKQVIVLTVK